MVTIVHTIVILYFSAASLQGTFSQLFDLKELLLLSAELGGLAIICYLLKESLYKLGATFVVALIVTYGAFCLVALLLNYRKILDLLRTVNKLR